MSVFPLSPHDGHPFLVLAASPRPGGNSDTAARLFLQGFSRTASGGEKKQAETRESERERELEPTYLRSYRVEPCVSCNACTHAANQLKSPRPAKADASEPGEFPHFGCPLALKDESAPLLRLLASAKGLCLVSPVYFYHLPAALKALVDRTQPFWAMRDAGISRYSGQMPRPCHVILLAARSRGDKLFAGSLLTLKYAFAPLNIQLAEPLLLHGLDEPSALHDQPEAMRSIVAYGAEAGKFF